MTTTLKPYKTDLEIANGSEMKHIQEIAESLHLSPEEYDVYGK